MRIKGTYLAHAGIILFSSVFLVFSTPSQASAASTYNLVSESVYLNKKAMTQPQIQSFLESKKSALATYKDQGPNETKKELASYLIWHAAQIWGINPQVILATLQKEQSLITKQSPTAIDYRSAMGYGCPDGADCNAKYYGFANQVNMASYQFRYNYEVLGGKTSFIDGDGDPHGVGSYACMWSAGKTFYNNHLTPGSTVTFQRNIYINGTKDRTVTIANKSTASLLCYTPHVGPYATTGYSGSDNFVYWFTQWFGNPVDEYNYSSENLVSSGGVINKQVSVTEGAEVLTIGSKIYTFYGDSSTNSFHLAHWNGSSWSDRTLDGGGSTVPWSLGAVSVKDITSFIYQGKPQVYYYDNLSKTLRHAFVNGKNQWAVETIDGVSWGVIGKTRDVGQSVTGFTYGTDDIQLYYYNNTDKRLEHSWWDGKRWRNEVMDGAIGGVISRTLDVGTSVSGLVLDGKIQLFYHSTTTGELIHTWWSDVKKSWSTERLDGDTDTVLGNYINAGKGIETAIHNGRLFIIYYDDATAFSGGRTSAWRIAYWNGFMWVQNTIDGGEGSQSGSTAAVPLGGISAVSFEDKSLQVFYKGSSNQLRHYWLRK